MQKFGLERARDLIHKADLYGDAENNDMFWKRLSRGFDKLLQNSADQDNIVVVSHGNTIRSIISRYAPELDTGYPTQNGSITKVILSDEQTPKVIYYDHLN
jgi:probable phosphoglycerate mutase